MSNPGSAVQGINSRAWIINASHGRGLLSVANVLNLNDAFGTSLIDEIGTPNPILNTQVYNGGDFSFDIYETDLPQLYAMLYDIDPATVTFAFRPENLYGLKFSLMTEGKSSITGKVIVGTLSEQCLISGHSRSTDAKGNVKVAFKGTLTKTTKMVGGGVWYTRIVKGTPYFVTSDDVAFTGSTATLAKTAVALAKPGINAGSDTYICAIYNKVKTDSLFTVSGTTFTATNTPSAYDVWDLMTGYQDV